MKNWDDFLPNDDDEQDDDMFGTNRDNNNPWLERQIEIEKSMLFADIQRGTPIPILPSDWEEIWGLTDDNKDDLTQLWVKHFMRLGDNKKGRLKLIDIFPREWMTLLLIHNEEKEEYEICSLLWEILTWLRKERSKAGLRVDNLN
jgi:hypothetical protein